MIGITITVSEEEIRKRLGKLADKSGIVISRAANRSINAGKKAIKQEAVKIYNIRQKDVEDTLKVSKATASHPIARMTFNDSHKNMFHFGKNSVVSPRFPIRSSSAYDPDPKNFFAKIMNSGGKKVLDGRPKPFVQIAAGSGNIALFQRVSDNPRAKLRGVAAPAIPQILKNEDVMARFTRDAQSMFIKRLEHEIERILKGAE